MDQVWGHRLEFSNDISAPDLFYTTPWPRGYKTFYFILSSEISAYQKQIKVISITSEII